MGVLWGHKSKKHSDGSETGAPHTLEETQSCRLELSSVRPCGTSNLHSHMMLKMCCVSFYISGYQLQNQPKNAMPQQFRLSLETGGRPQTSLREDDLAYMYTVHGCSEGE